MENGGCRGKFRKMEEEIVEGLGVGEGGIGE